MRRGTAITTGVAVAIIAGITIGLLAGLLPNDDSNSTLSPETTSSVTTPHVAPWPHEQSDIPLDPSIRVGSLDNGMRYMIMSHGEPPGKLALRLHVDAGSFMEEDDQQGLVRRHYYSCGVAFLFYVYASLNVPLLFFCMRLSRHIFQAHFLEHMLFNGLKHFSPGELIPKMNRLGIAFGSHVNAYTSYDETVYQLDLPNTNEPVLDLCFTVLRDYADGALLEADEIEQERGVVLSEMAARDSPARQIRQEEYQFLWPDHLLAQRSPIGTQEVLSTAPRERFVDFYTKYYNPERITFVAVGDMDVDVLEARVWETFASMVMPENPGTEPDLGQVPAGTGFRTAVFTHEELGTSTMYLLTYSKFQPRLDTEAQRIADMPIYLANRILRRRFEIIATQEGVSITRGRALQYDNNNAVTSGLVEVTPVNGRWMEALQVLEQEFRRAREHGFTKSELMEIAAEVQREFEQRVESAATRKSSDIASGLTNTVNGHAVFATPAENLRIIEKGLATMTPEILHEAFVTLWNTTDITLILNAKEAAENTTDVMATLYAESETVAVAPPIDYADVPFSYTNFGTPGTIVLDVTQEDLGIRQLVLSNNVRVNMKQTGFEENSIPIVARFGTGLVGLPKNQAGLAPFTKTVMDLGGLGNHSHFELARILAGRNVGVSLSIAEDGFQLSGSTTPADLELQLQLMAAFISDPGYREEAVRKFRQAIPETINRQEHTLNGASQRMQEWLHGDDERFAVPIEEELMSLEASDAKDWIHPQLVESYLEISIVGDFDWDAAIPLVLKTIGALPMRADSIDTDVDRSISFPTTPDNATFTYNSKLPTAAAVGVWGIPPLTESTINEFRRLTVLTAILDDRIFFKIREDLGVSYSPRASTGASTGFDYGTITASAIGAPKDVDHVSEVIVEIAKNLAEQGASQDEFDRAIEPRLVSLDSTLRSNRYWLLSVMEQSQAKPYELDWSRSRGDVYAAMNLEEINDLAKKYLGPDKALRITLLPVDKDDDDASSVIAGATVPGS